MNAPVVKWEERLMKDKASGSDYQTELEVRLLEAVESLDAGRGVDGEEVFARLRQRSKARHRNAECCHLRIC